MIRFLSLSCVLVCLGVPHGVAADSDSLANPPRFELRSLEEDHRLGHRAARLSVTIASINVVYLTSGAVWIAGAHDSRSAFERRTAYTIGAVQLAAWGANFVWLVFAGETLRDYKQKAGLFGTVRRARLDTAMTGIDTAFRLAGTVGGIVALANRSRGTGLLFLIPNLTVLPFHIWALVANAKELRYRKRKREWTTVRRVEPIPNGFRF